MKLKRLESSKERLTSVSVSVAVCKQHANGMPCLELLPGEHATGRI